MIDAHEGHFERYRDVFIEDKDDPNLKYSDKEITEDPTLIEYQNTRKIYVYTRTGGGNREEWINEKLRPISPNRVRGNGSEPALAQKVRTYSLYLNDYDDVEYDVTYMTFVFKVPPQWHGDYDMLKIGKSHLLSDSYKEHVESIYGDVKWE